MTRKGTDRERPSVGDPPGDEMPFWPLADRREGLESNSSPFARRGDGYIFVVTYVTIDIHRKYW